MMKRDSPELKAIRPAKEATDPTPGAMTPYGLPIDHGFAVAATGQQLQGAAASLREHGMIVEVLDTVADARSFVNTLLPLDETIFTASSETVRLSGLDEDINGSGRFKSLRQQLSKMDPRTQFPEMRRLGAAPDVVIGSVHAVTETGELVIASATGSQLGPYAAGAGKAIWVVGAQKVVSDHQTALRRIQTYAYPKEDLRSREATGRPSSVSKVLTIRKEVMPGRGTVVLVREPIGF